MFFVPWFVDNFHSQHLRFDRSKLKKTRHQTETNFGSFKPNLRRKKQPKKTKTGHVKGLLRMILFLLGEIFYAKC